MDSISPETCTLLKKFYTRDDISQMSAGKRDVVTVRSPEGKLKLQKRHMFMSIKETHSIFKEEHPYVKIGISKFAELRPANVLLSRQTPPNVCLCLYHQNFIMAVDALSQRVPEVPSYSKDFPSSCLKDPDDQKCWFSECEHEDCGFSKIYSLQAADNRMQAGTKWMKWSDVDGRLQKREERGTVEELFNQIASMAPKFLKHCFVKRRQAGQYEADKAEALQPESKMAVLQMDFAENFTCCSQDEVQSAHWNQAQVTLYTTVTWFRGKTLPSVVISDCMQHDKTAVIIFTDQILSAMPAEVSEICIWTDGPASQFKNKFVMAGIKVLSHKHGKQLKWNFSATGHGKGPVDGIGATLKRTAVNGIKTRKFVINGAQDFYDNVKSPSVHTSLISAELIQERVSALNLEAVFGDAKTVPGISQFHYIKPSADGFITKRYTAESEESKSTTECDSEDSTIGLDNNINEYVPETGHVVAVKLAGKRPHVVYVYMAQVLQIDKDEANLRYLKRCGNLYQWMSDRDDAWQPLSDILCVMPHPDLVNNRAQLSFPELSLLKVKDIITSSGNDTIHWK